MVYLVIANLVFSVALIAAAGGAGLHFYLKRRRRKLATTRPGNPAADYAVQDTRRRGAGSLNYSSFIYLDVDRDGRYGLADRPMGGIMVRLTAGGQHLLSSRTNGNGFANFTMSTRQRKAQIKSAGTYTFTVSVPPGWVATSDNDVQTMAFALAEGSPAGIVAEAMVKPVGIAPIRFVRGTNAAEGTLLRFTRQGEQVGEQALGDKAGFSARVPDGADAVTVKGPGVERRLTLSTYPADLGIITPQRQSLPDGAALQTIDFDGVTPRGLRKIPSGYAGLNWFNLNAISRDFQGGSEGYVNGNTSGDHTCYTSSGHPAELWRDTPFGFHSVMLSSAWLRSEGEICIVEVWQGDAIVARDEIAVSALTPVHYAPQLKDITRIRFSSKRSWQIAIDDLVVAL